MAAKHSPEPWQFEANGDNPSVDGYIINDANGGQVAMVESAENAAFICVLVNANATRREEAYHEKRTGACGEES